MYIILPFYYNGKWRFIAGCRYIDQLDTLADVLEQMDK